MLHVHVFMPKIAMLRDDVRCALRALRRSPGYTLAVGVALSIGIGANTALFSVVSAVLLKPLPYPESAQLVALHETVDKFHIAGAPLSTIEFGALRAAAKSYQALGAYESIDGELSTEREAETLHGVKITASVFDVLGVPAAIGRVFTTEEDFDGSDGVVISQRLWRNRFGADPTITSRRVLIDRKPRTILGVMPAGFVFPLRGPADNSEPADFFIPMGFTANERQGRGPILQKSVVARLRPGITLDGARAEAKTLTPVVIDEVGKVFAPRPAYKMSFTVESLRTDVTGNVSRILWLLSGAVGVLLLIACANVANLTLSRVSARRRERAIRAAMGAGRFDLIRLALTESFVIAIMAGAAGVALAASAVRVFAAYAPVPFPRTEEIRVDLPAIAFTLAIAVLTAILSGLTAAISPVSSMDAFRDGGRGISGGRARMRSQSLLTSAQFGLTVILMIAGSLAVRSLIKTINTDPGFRPDQAAAITTHLPASFYSKAAQIRNVYLRVAAEAETSGRIVAAGIGSELPLGNWEKGTIIPEGNEAVDVASNPLASQVWVTGRYLEALGVPLRKGRFFYPVEYRESRGVVIINESLARALWPGRDAVGRRVRNSRSDMLTVIGVVGDIKEVGLNHAPVSQIFEPHSQLPDRLMEMATIPFFRTMNLVSRSSDVPSTQIRQLTAAVQKADKSLAISGARGLGEVVDESSRGQRLNTFIAVSFAAIALVLAILGVASVLVYAVSQRTQEIGIRMALGATPSSVSKMILTKGFGLAVAGVAVGLLTSFAIMRLLGSFLYGVSPWDPLTFIAMPLILLAMALAAAWLPARLAAKVDPMISLRADA